MCSRIHILFGGAGRLLSGVSRLIHYHAPLPYTATPVVGSQSQKKRQVTSPLGASVSLLRNGHLCRVEKMTVKNMPNAELGTQSAYLMNAAPSLAAGTDGRIPSLMSHVKSQNNSDSDCPLESQWPLTESLGLSFPILATLGCPIAGLQGERLWQHRKLGCGFSRPGC